MISVHRFVWGYGPNGYDIIARDGSGQALEAPCLDEIDRWKLSFDRVASIVTPVRLNGKPLCLLAFRSRLATRPAGDHYRETVCAAVPWASAPTWAAHRELLSRVPSFPGGSEPRTECSTEALAVPDGAWPPWAPRVWAQLGGQRPRVVLCEPGATIRHAIDLVALLPPGMARTVPVGEGLLAGTEHSRDRGFFIALQADSDAKDPVRPNTTRVDSDAARPARDGQQWERLLAVWSEHKIFSHGQDAEAVARAIWTGASAASAADTDAIDEGFLRKLAASDAIADWLCAGNPSIAQTSLDRWVREWPALETHVQPWRVAERVLALPPSTRDAVEPRLFELVHRSRQPDEGLATLCVGLAMESALRAGGMPLLEALRGAPTWLGGALGTPRPATTSALYAQIAWRLLGELLVEWSGLNPEALTRALADPLRVHRASNRGLFRRLLGRMARGPRTVEEALRSLSTQPTGKVPSVRRELLPDALRLPEGRSGLTPANDTLRDLLVCALSVAVSGTTTAGIAALALAPLRDLGKRASMPVNGANRDSKA